jgi:hypothetical protein
VLSVNVRVTLSSMAAIILPPPLLWNSKSCSGVLTGGNSATSAARYVYARFPGGL